MHLCKQCGAHHFSCQTQLCNYNNNCILFLAGSGLRHPNAHLHNYFARFLFLSFPSLFSFSLNSILCFSDVNIKCILQSMWGRDILRHDCDVELSWDRASGYLLFSWGGAHWAFCGCWTDSRVVIVRRCQQQSSVRTWLLWRLSLSNVMCHSPFGFIAWRSSEKRRQERRRKVTVYI